MDHGIFSASDRQQLHARGITEETALTQIALFQRGIPYTTLHRPCTVGDGIVVLQPDELTRLATIHAAAARSGRMLKFVPASGAASRMFKLLLSFLQRCQDMEVQQIAAHAERGDEECQEFLRWVERLKQFAFYDDLKAVMRHHGLDLDTLAAQEKFQDMLA